MRSIVADRPPPWYGIFTMELSRRTIASMFFAGTAAVAASGPETATATPVTTDIYAVQSRISTPNFQLFLDLADDSSVAATGPLFSPAGGLYAADFLDDVLYATELDNTTLTDYFLVTINYTGPQRGTGARVSVSPIGVPAVEGLAVIDGTIYVTSLDFAAHRTTLATLDKTTGTATPIGQAARNVMLTGLAYDPVAAKLYGAGVPFGAGEPSAVDVDNLYMLDPATGAETLIGPLGSRIESLSWDTELGLIGSFDRLYSIDATTGAASAIGSSDFTDGLPGTLNGIYALAAHVPDGIGPPAGVCGDPIAPPSPAAGTISSVVTATDALFVLGVAISAQTCEPCVCDVDDSGAISATDALIVLRVAVGTATELNCPVCS